MKKFPRTVAVLAGLILIASSAFAEEGTGSTGFWSKTKVTGSVDVNYNVNLNRPTITGPGAPANTNAYRAFDSNANTFNIGLMELAIENTPTDWVTFRTDLDFGRDASLIHAAGLGGAEFVDLQQAHVILKAANVGNGLSFKIGKFVTMHGAEVIEASANNNISRSFLFNYAIPYTHTGVLASYPFSDMVSLDLGVVNGWNNVLDNNNGKSIHSMLTLKPTDKVTWFIGGTFGPETAGTSSMYRYLVDSTITFTPNEIWTVALNYDLGRDGGLGAGAGKGISDWQGFAAYVHAKPFDFMGISLRGEYYKDLLQSTVPLAVTVPPTVLGTAGANLPIGAVQSDKLFEATLTSHFYLADGLDLRFEYRHDHGNNASFLKGTGTTRKFQDTIASQLVYAF